MRNGRGHALFRISQPHTIGTRIYSIMYVCECILFYFCVRPPVNASDVWVDGFHQKKVNGRSVCGSNVMLVVSTRVCSSLLDAYYHQRYLCDVSSRTFRHPFQREKETQTLSKPSAIAKHTRAPNARDWFCTEIRCGTRRCVNRPKLIALA